jgi:RND family efflux transporter MFP subunit
MRRSYRSNWWLVTGLGAVVALGAGFHALAIRNPAAAAEAAGASAAADDKDGGKPGEAGNVSYPVTLSMPIRRAFAEPVHGFGTVRPDARRARSVTNATQGVVSEVLVVPGERVRRGQALVRLEPDPLALLAYQQAVNSEKLARREVARLTAQRADHLATASQVEAAEKTLEDAVAAVEAARRQGAAGALATLSAPIDGVVTVLAATAGDRPAVGTVLATIAPLTERIPLGIEPGLRPRVRVGDRVTVQAVQAEAAPISGHVAAVSAALDPDSRLVTVWVTIPAASSEGLLAGSAVTGTIETHPVEAYSLPRAALVKDDEGVSVFTVRDGKAHRVRVAVVADDGPRVGVTGDLGEAVPVVTTGAYELEDGVEVGEQKP